MDAPRDERELSGAPAAAPEAPASPGPSPRKVLAARLFSLGLIPFAVFCALFVLVRAMLGAEVTKDVAWTVTIALVMSILALFLLCSLIARGVMGEVQTLREAMRAAAGGNAPGSLPEFTPPVEALKPWCCESLVIREPIVSMIFHPPDSVPRAMAT